MCQCGCRRRSDTKAQRTSEAGNHLRVAIYKCNSPVEICQSRVNDESKQNVLTGAICALDLDSPGLFALYFPSNDIFGGSSGQPSLVEAQVKERNRNTRVAERHGMRGSSFSLPIPTDALTGFPSHIRARTPISARTVFGVVGGIATWTDRHSHGRTR